MPAANTPLVSVHCPVFNGERFLEESVRSVLDQTFQDLEMVVVDDGSSDGSWNLLEDLAREDHRLRLLRHGRGGHRGLNASLRLAVDHSAGPYLAGIDQDDRWAPDKLEHQVETLDAGAQFCFGRAIRIDDEGHELPVEHGGGRIGARWDEFPASAGATPFEALMMRNYIPACTAMFSREAYDRVGGYPAGGYSAELGLGNDFALWTRLVALSEPAFLDKILADYRIHPTQTTTRLEAEGMDSIEGNVRIIEELRGWPGLPEQLVPVTDSWQRCHGALAFLVGGDVRSSEAALEEEDADRLARLLLNRWARLSELIGSRRVRRWTAEIRRLSPAFDHAIGRTWKLYLFRCFRSAYRQGHMIEAARFATALVSAKVDDYRWRHTHAFMPMLGVAEDILPALGGW
jgi:glycosyltransferase involved in cell wall biosynthesis